MYSPQKYVTSYLVLVGLDIDFSQMTTGLSDEDNKSVIKSEMSNPAGRPGKDTDMAATVLFLAGPGGVL